MARRLLSLDTTANREGADAVRSPGERAEPPELNAFRFGHQAVPAVPLSARVLRAFLGAAPPFIGLVMLTSCTVGPDFQAPSAPDVPGYMPARATPGLPSGERVPGRVLL